MMLAVSGCAASGLASPSAMETSSPMASPTPRASASPSRTTSPSVSVEPAKPTPGPATTGGPILDLLAADPPPRFVSPITCEGSIGDLDPVAIVRLRAPDDGVPPYPVLRDYADVAAPRTACTFGAGDYWIHSLIDARHVVIGGGPDQQYAVVDLPEVRYHWFRLPRTELSFTSLMAVAPSLDSVTWRRASTDGSLARQILMTDASGDHVLVDLPAIETGRCGSPLDSSEGAYARTGESFHVLDQPYASMNVFLAGLGTDVELTLYPPDAGWDETSMPLMPVWSPISETLYYRVGVEVMRWSPGSDPEVFLADTPWSRPTFTPDGNHLAYATDEGVFLVDMTRDPAPRLIRADASLPVFLNSSQLWFKAADAGGCVTGEISERIYDLRDGSEAPSIIDEVIAVWPATSSSSR
jgi:hypothetical protein